MSASEGAKMAFTKPFNYKLKWAITVMRPQIWSKWSKIWKWNLTVSPKTCSSEYALVSERQSYFTYGDIQSGWLKIQKIQVTQQTINKCTARRYSDFSKMCLKPMEIWYFCNVQQKEKEFRNFKMPKGRLTSLHEWGSRRKLANLIAVIQFAYKSPTHLSTSIITCSQLEH